MLNKLREYWLDRTFKKSKRVHRFLNLNEMKTILILFDFQDRMEVILMAENLSKMGKNVILWTAISNDTELDQVLLPKKIRIIKPKELSPFFILKKEVLAEFSELKYDTLLDIRKDDQNIGLEYLLASNNSKCCVGFRSHPRKAFDICILRQAKKNILETYEQMKFYLLKIQN